MRLFILLSVLFLCSFTAFAQKGQKRFIAFVELEDPANLPYNRYNSSVTDLATEAAKSGRLPIYYFDSFKKSPKTITWQQLAQKLEAQDRARFKTWNEKETYRAGDEVSNGEYRYRSLVNDNVSYIGDYGGWEYIAQSNKILGIDILLKDGKDTTVQYIHFYSDNFTYEASFRADELSNELNATNHLWHRIEDHFIDHLATDLSSLLDYSSRYPAIAELAASPGIQDALSEARSNTGVLAYHKNGLVSEFFVFIAMDNYEYPVVFDTLTIKNQKPAAITAYRLGDALVHARNIRFSSKYKTILLKPLSMSFAIPGINKVDTITCDTWESFWLTRQPTTDKKFESNVVALLELIYKGISDGQIHVVPPNSMDPYSTDDLILNWTIVKPTKWDPESRYYEGQKVLENGRVYIASGVDSSGVAPSHQPGKWTIKTQSEEIVQPDDFTRFEFQYTTTFSADGRSVEKRPEWIGLERHFNGSMTLFGYISFVEIQEYAKRESPSLWKVVTPWFEHQEGLYRTFGHGRLKYKGK